MKQQRTLYNSLIHPEDKRDQKNSIDVILSIACQEMSTFLQWLGKRLDEHRTEAEKVDST